MKFRLLIILIFTFVVKLYAGAPAPSTSLPQPPYIFKKGTLLTINVEWKKKAIKKYLPENNETENTINGGIDVYFTKHKKPLNKIDYALMWVNLQNEEKKIFLAFVGPDYDSNRLIEKISEKSLNLAKSRLMLINNKVSFRTNVNNKQVFNLSGNINEKCKSIEGKPMKISKDNNKFFIISNKAALTCGLNNIELDFSENYNELEVNKILSGLVFKNTDVTFKNLLNN